MAHPPFVKGRTNNHLTWAMVDATDFATPESALSAAMKIKIYGKLRGATGVNFVSSGTGSLTNDIQHVGASVLGLYTIALAKADLSDASAAWYDQYVVSLSATGAAYQALIVDGGIDLSALSKLQSTISDMASYLVVMSGIQSDILSSLSDLQSDFQSRVPKRVATDSQLSDMASDIKSYLAVMSGVQSDLYSLLSDHHSDFQSRVPKRVATDSQLSDMASDLKSAIAAGPAATVTASDISDIASAVWANAIGARVDSRVLVIKSTTSDTYSLLSDLQSDFQSRVTKAVATNSQLSDLHSDLRSYLVVMSSLDSDIYSQLSDFRSDLHSFVSTTGVQLNASSISDLRSAIAAVTASVSASDMSDLRSAITASTSDLRSLISSAGPTLSDLASAVKVELASDLSDILSAATAGASRALLNQSRISDIASYLVVMSGIQSDLYSQLSDFRSDLHSFVSTTGVQLNASSISDLRSAIAAGPAATVTASDISDIASAVWANAIGTRVDSRVLVAQSYLSDIRSQITAGVPLQASDMSDIRSAIAAGPAATVTASDISDIASAVWANTIGARVDSRVLVNKSTISDIYSLLSDMQSDFQSRVPKRVATDSQLSDLASDLRSVAIVNQSVVSDIYSLLSDANSDLRSLLIVNQSVASDVLSAATAIKAKTDNLTFTVANQLDANVQAVNDTALLGNGGTVPWGPV